MGPGGLASSSYVARTSSSYVARGITLFVLPPVALRHCGVGAGAARYAAEQDAERRVREENEMEEEEEEDDYEERVAADYEEYE